MKMEMLLGSQLFSVLSCGPGCSKDSLTRFHFGVCGRLNLKLGSTSAGSKRRERITLLIIEASVKYSSVQSNRGYDLGFADAGGSEEEPEKVSRITRVHLFTNTVVRMLTASQLSRAGRTSRKKDTAEVPGRARPA